MSGVKGYFYNTLWMMSRPVLRLAAAFCVGIFVIRYLGPAQFGQLSFAESFARLFMPLVVLGMDPILVKDLVTDSEKSDAMLGTALVLKIIGFIGAFICVCIAVQFTSTDRITKLMTIIIALSLCSFPPINVLEQHFHAQVKAKFTSFCENVSVFISAGLKALFVSLRFSVVWFAVVIVIERVCRMILIICVYIRHGGCFSTWTFNRKYAGELMRLSWPLLLSGVSSVLYLRVDQVMIKEMIGNEALGNYAAAVRLSELWYFIPMTICASLFPAIVAAKNASHELFLNRMHNLYAFLFWIAIVIALPMSFLSTVIVTTLFGESFAQAGPVLSIHIWAAVFFFFQTASSRWLISQGQTRKILYLNAGGLGINLFLNFILIPCMGISGAAVATLVAQFYSGFLYDALDKDMRTSFLLKLKVWTPFWRIV